MLFGKLPAHGDFVARGMDARERDWWDEQLSLAVGQAMEAHGVAFAERYDAARPWCFQIRHGATMVTGAMLASRDRVGRRFPVVLARRDRSGAAGCATALLAARDGGWTADALSKHFGPPENDAAPLPRGWWPSGTLFPSEAAIDADTPIPTLTAMLAETDA